MGALQFPSEESLIAIIASGTLPDGVAGGPVRYARGDDGPVLVGTLPSDVREALEARGVSDVPVPAVTESVSCWAEVLRCRASAPPEVADPVLFVCPVDRLVELAGELIRLGCDRQRWAVSGDLALVLTADPPWYTVLKAFDPRDPVRAYVQAVPGVWVEIGFSHPLAHAVRPPAGHLLLIPGEGPWIRSTDGPWTPLYDRLDLVLGEVPVVLEAGDDPPRLKVALRLVDSGRNQPPSLWVLRDDALARMDRFLSNLPDEVVGRLLFAATTEDPPRVVLRARPSPSGPPAIDLPAERYSPLLELPNLYRPDDATLEPPLRRDRVRETLAPEPFEVAWLARTADGFQVERIAEGAFRPLQDWVEYVASRSESALNAWIGSTLFEFDDWVDLGIEWSERPKRETAPPKKPAAKPRPSKVEPEVAYVDKPVKKPTTRLRAKTVAIVATTEQPELIARLTDLEHRFLELDLPPDAPERGPLWREMATLNRQLGRQRAASLCWAHLVWDAPEPQRMGLIQDWAAEELGSVGVEVDALRAAVLESQSHAALHATAACLAAGEIAPDAELARVFQENDNRLDVRTAWLVHRALAGEDPLAVARARDRLVIRIRTGLSLERDTPGFLRMLDATAVETLRSHLEAQLDHFQRTKRNRAVIEADPKLTGAYVNLIFAWGFAALGDRERSGGLQRDIEALDLSDNIHGALVNAYRARIDQALEGVAREAPMPPEALAGLNGLSAFERYKVDRLRLFSGILESQERLDPFMGFSVQTKGDADPRGNEFAELREMTDTSALRSRLQDILTSAESTTEASERMRLLDGALDFFALLAPADAIELLERATAQFAQLEALDRTRVLEDALMVAGQLGRADTVRSLIQQMHDALIELTNDELANSGDGLAKGLRSLRRVGLQDEAATLLDAVIERASGRDVRSLTARVAVAGGLTGVGREETAQKIIDEGLDALDGDFSKPMDRLQLTRALAIALSSAPRELALERLPRLSAHLPSISDSFNTNSHFCLSVLHFAESVVLGYTDASLALGPTARRWLDDAEYLVRRRIQRE